MPKKSRAQSGQTPSADKASERLPPARETHSRAEGQPGCADKASRGVPNARETHSSVEGQQRCADKATPGVPETLEPDAAGIEGQPRRADKARHMVPHSPQRFSNDPRIQDLIAEARNRTYWMNMRLRNTARLVAEIRALLQPGRGQEEEWNEDTKSEALSIVNEAVAAVLHSRKQAQNSALGKKVRERKPGLEHPLLAHPIVFGTAISLADYEAREDESLSRMEDIVASLPISAWIGPHCKGFTLAGLAVLIGHAGDFRDYPKKGHLWKRLGLAPYEKDGVTRAGSSWGRHGGLSKDDWIILGYKRSRLGDIFGKVTQPLLYAQWRSTGAIGPYGEAYGRYKARQKGMNEAGAFAAEVERQIAAAKKSGRKPVKALLEGRLPDSQINSRALRYMTKSLIADLWSAWRRLGQKRCADKAKHGVPAAAEIARDDGQKSLANDGQAARATPGQPNSAADGTAFHVRESASIALPTAAEPNADARGPEAACPKRATSLVPKRRRLIREAAE